MGKRAKLKPYLYLLPMLACACAFVYYPFVRTFTHAFSIVNEMGRATGYAGLENFRYLFSRRDFAQALSNTLLLTVVNVPATVALTLTLALLSEKKRRLSGVYEIMTILPIAVSMAASAMLFKVMLNPTVGVAHRVLGLSLGGYESRESAPWAILLLTVWMGVGMNYLLLLAALRGVSRDMLDAAALDGAGAARRLFCMRIPAIAPTLLYVICTNTVLAMMTSGPIIIITQGGPSRATTTLIYMMYASGYGSSNYSLAACLAIVAFALTFLLMALAFRLERGGGETH